MSQVATDPQTFTIAAAAPMTLTGTLPGGTVGVPYSADLTLGGTFTAPVTMAASSGTLPAWMTVTVTGTTVNYAGTPTTATSYSWTPHAIDSSTVPQSATDPQSVTVSAAVVWSDYWNPSVKDSKITLSSGNKIATRSSATAAWCAALGVTGNLGTAVYFEVYINSLSNKMIVGLGASAINTGSFLGATNSSFGYHSGGGYQTSVGYTATALGSYGSGDTIMVGIRPVGTSNRAFFGKNGVWDGDPVAGTGSPAALSNLTATQYAAVSLFQSGGQVTLRMVNSEFTYAPPTGFSSWSGS